MSGVLAGLRHVALGVLLASVGTLATAGDTVFAGPIHAFSTGGEGDSSPTSGGKDSEQ